LPQGAAQRREEAPGPGAPARRRLPRALREQRSDLVFPQAVKTCVEYLGNGEVRRRYLNLIGTAKKGAAARRACTPDQLLRQARLADARLTADEHDAAVSGGGLFEPLPKHGEFALAADERHASA